MDSIRVTYSGLISFAIGIGSVITGTVFTLILTRQLSIEEFGTWNLIGTIIAYMLLMESSIFFWITRETARKIPSAKTGFVSTGLLSTVAMLIFVVIAFLIGNQSNADVSMMLFAVILIPVYFLNHTLSGINAGWKPQVVSYGFITIEIIKIPLGLLLIYFLDLGIQGVIITMLISYIASIIVQSIFAREKLKSKFQMVFVKKWLKLSWVALFRDIPGTLFVSDIVIFSIITGNVIGIAYIAAARAISNIVKHSGQISIALYPVMLAGGKQEHLQENLMRIFYFSFPSVAFSITFAKPGLFALNPEYAIASFLVIFLALRTFMATINRVFRVALQGIDKVDVSENSKFKDYLKSSLITLPTLRIIQYISYIILLITGLFLMVQQQADTLDLIGYWAILSLVIEVPFVIYFSILIKRTFTLQFNIKSILKYFLSSVITFGSVYVLMEEFLIYEISIFNFLPNIILYILLAIVFYLSLTYLIDSKIRNLFSAVINEVIKKRNNEKGTMEN